MNIQNEGLNNEYRCTWIICACKKAFFMKEIFFSFTKDIFFSSRKKFLSSYCLGIFIAEASTIKWRYASAKALALPTAKANFERW